MYSLCYGVFNFRSTPTSVSVSALSSLYVCCRWYIFSYSFTGFMYLFLLLKKMKRNVVALSSVQFVSTPFYSILPTRHGNRRRQVLPSHMQGKTSSCAIGLAIVDNYTGPIIYVRTYIPYSDSEKDVFVPMYITHDFFMRKCLWKVV